MFYVTNWSRFPLLMIFFSIRGSLPNAQPQCIPEPGKHICHRPLAPIGNWTDTVDQIAAEFGLDPDRLCTLNKLANCSEFDWVISAFKIPVTPAPLLRS
jgi:hypothetical protein